MAATVVSVVIFLCGVLVGRGVRAERRAVAEAEVLSASPSADAQPASPSGAAVAQGRPATAGADPTIVPPPPPADDSGDIRPSVPLGAAAVPKKDRRGQTVAAEGGEVRGVRKGFASLKRWRPLRRPAPAAAPEKPAVATTAPPKPASDGWVVQVAALNTREVMPTSCQRPHDKGFQRLRCRTAAGTSIYRVRVGSFKTRREAETMAEKLRKERA